MQSKRRRILISAAFSMDVLMSLWLWVSILRETTTRKATTMAVRGTNHPSARNRSICHLREFLFFIDH